ncbi:DUF4394 domain-containing protein [Litoribacter alkaliphilus]|uniref:DUF4394 domain-containing protein n=1 Tax=Litoribacter ruber TaxID=702568 RepID=A0AAP2G3K9_9BACT|nr:DUF4394 domain-containing protein [Litoribacter alkaliphilus]MBS9523116.1 DUF4394 domain-containing protein [Litoribacter alkaliphilus]
MKKPFNYNALIALVCGAVLWSCTDEIDSPPGMDGDHDNDTAMPGDAPEIAFTALSSDNQLVWFQARDLSSPLNTVSITGLEDGDEIVSIDYRPATGQLYGLGSSSRLYIINENSGEATALGDGPFSPALEGENASLDFNPTVDRIRVVTNSGQNLRLHPELGTVVAEDGAISGGDNPMIGAVAYTNSMAGAESTELFDIDFSTNKLYVQDPPNDGGLREIGDLGVDFNGTGNFDISPDNSAALAVVYNEQRNNLYTINLTTGAAQNVGEFSHSIIGIAIKTNPIAFATSPDNRLYRFNPLSPSDNYVDLDGLGTGETVVGLDFRPANGQLYAITSESRLMTVNTANGELMEVGTLSPYLDGTSFGFDFNPTVDRIRLVSNTGQNLRLHPDEGTVVEVDGDLNPGSPYVNAAAYTNNIPTATETMLFVLDSETNALYTQDPPNDGVLNMVGELGIAFTSENGFDIGGTSDNAYALLEVDGAMGVYQIDLSSGEASKVSDFNISATAMALGLGF